ncbi:BQ5605_C064g12794 [Microbotryum silenes-dioicae]|nr:BQ5605_C010g06222 [Microbotryum silenes-dioicae]SGZ23112.1 BQ5605_C022g09589 [Microbotryum silenes-dioicae]SGZ29282.1 BQ5605_C055g12661 [Microbotryum silenes-dioicae]SGZ31013.1 BQ5605_C047g12284 [Microbotryum silenes-dioicae]SGZ35183.1 BQ5605_C064g12794 [Microbotryum silenes-dioicae]
MCPPCPNRHSNLSGQLELQLDDTYNVDDPISLTPCLNATRYASRYISIRPIRL